MQSRGTHMTTEQQPLQEAFHFTAFKEHDPKLYGLAQQMRHQVTAAGWCAVQASRARYAKLA
jgi:hypothetical protein